MASRFSDEFFARAKALADEAGALDKDICAVIADEFGEKPRAVIAAVKRAGIAYKRVERKTKTGEKPVTKEALVATIAEKLGLEVEALDGLDKATKTALEAVLEGVGE
jgi:hypothetical protein